MEGHVRLAKVLRPLWEDDRSGLPRYLRLAAALEAALRKRVLHAGDRLPAEEDLTRMTPFSLGTVQRALRELANQGSIVRRHGLGNFVADEQHRIPEPGLCKFLGDDGVTVLPIYSMVVDRRKLEEPGRWTDYLGADSDNVMRIDRVVSVNDEFNVFSRFYARASLLKPLWEEPIEQLHGENFTRLIETRCRLSVTDLSHLVTNAEPDIEVREVLQLQARKPILCVQIVARAGRETCAYYQELFVPPTQRAMVIAERVRA